MSRPRFISASKRKSLDLETELNLGLTGLSLRKFTKFKIILNVKRCYTVTI